MSKPQSPDEINGLIERLRKAAAEMRTEDQPGWPNLCDEAADALYRITELTAEVERLREALAPSAGTKAAYIGEFSFDVAASDEGGNEVWQRTYVPWSTIKEIMAAIRARAALSHVEAL